jgi:hypothetical protein
MCAWNGRSGIVIYGKGASPEIQGNFLYENTQSGLVVFDHATPEVSLNLVIGNRWGIRNGDVPGRADGGIVNSGYNCVRADGDRDFVRCDPADTDIQEDPKLVQLDDGSYRLAKDSPCVGAGPNGENVGGLAVVGERPEEETEPDADR